MRVEGIEGKGGEGREGGREGKREGERGGREGGREMGGMVPGTWVRGGVWVGVNGWGLGLNTC